MRYLNNSAEPFIIPAKLRPARIEYITVDQCNAATNTPQCFTSLGGVSYTLPY